MIKKIKDLPPVIPWFCYEKTHAEELLSKIKDRKQKLIDKEFNAIDL